ncbi:MAG: PAS-domain containing protein, partial [Pseudomonadota bacterium]
MRSFTAWRDALLRLGQTGHPSSYREDWTLPSGKVIGVTARHHTGGALVFMFEDISNQIMLERRYRQEMETSQTTLDSLEDGIVVFDTAGALIFANTSFEHLWEIESMQTVGAPSIKELVAHMSARSDCPDVWERFASFVQSADTRATWTADVPLRDGPAFRARFTTLPDGSAMAIFSEARTISAEFVEESSTSPMPLPNSVRVYLEDR